MFTITRNNLFYCGMFISGKIKWEANSASFLNKSEVDEISAYLNKCGLSHEIKTVTLS